MNELTCILCPRGCIIYVAEGGKTKGAQCPRGEEYAKSELSHPMRMVTSTVKLTGANLPRLPVRTSAPIPKSLMEGAVRLLDGVQVTAPVKTGDVILRDILDTGVDFIATKRAEKVEGTDRSA